jgi:hypothetical protein
MRARPPCSLPAAVSCAASASSPIAVRAGLVALLLAATAGAGCEAEVGLPCDPNTAEVLRKVEVEPGKNDLVRDVSFDNCSQALCASIDGGRPFCTKECENDLECAEAGEGFVCSDIVAFGQLGCFDFTPAEECDADGDGNGFPCDCFDAEGIPSRQLRKYCAAPPAVLAARDEEFGRPPFDPDAE